MNENKNELVASHRFARYPTITITEWNNGSFSASKTQLKDKNIGWKDKSNIERKILLSFYSNELFLVKEVLKSKKSIGNFEFTFIDGKVNIIKSYEKQGQKETKKYDMSINEYFIILELVNRIVEADYELYKPTKQQENNNVNNEYFDDLPVEEDNNINDDIPF